ncbi:hypothetical protein C8F04DRAFT_1273273 [Mycena alexandri]|uniref:Uncharacterized protein n=1 Tax=Mycena alexandri TaxID=1745969 RepID=A0AAD6S5Z5_9AGAR|nr:hypothetical protein C8F04DRAFT_1273273 [Mycena alexandri]
MGMEDRLPPSSPPSIFDSPPRSPYTYTPDFASAIELDFGSEFTSGNFDSPNPLAYASGAPISQTPSHQYYHNAAFALESPSLGPGPPVFSTPMPMSNLATPDTSSASARYRTVACDLCGHLVKCYKNSLAPLRVHRESRPCNTKKAKNDQAKERAATAAALTALHPQTLIPEVALPSLSFAIPTQRTNPSDSVFLRGRELARSQRRACSTSRSRSPNPGQRSSSAPADTYAPLFPSLELEDPAPLPTECPGILLDLAALDAYPWGVHLTRTNLPYRLDHFTGERDLTRLWVRSLECNGSAGIAQPECAPCRSVRVGQTVATLETRAEAAPSHTPWGYLNQRQLISGWRATVADKNEQHLKMLTMTKKAARSTSRMGDQKRLVMALSTCDVPRLSTLMRVAAKQRVGPKEMIRRISDAASALSPGGYRPKSFTDTEKKLMRCMKRFCGAKRRIRAVQGAGTALCIYDPVAAPKPQEIGTNIRTFFGAASPNSTLSRAGHTLMIDGVHLAQRACWHRPTKQIIGLCREHSEPFNLAMDDMDSVLNIVEAVHSDSPTCHYGREATVLAIGPYRETHYHGVPIGQTQTCKSEKGPGFAALLKMTLEEWKTHGEPHSGPILTVSFDGDPVFRDGAFDVLMIRTPDKSSSLSLKLSGCQGLNLECGEDDVVIGPDGKHIVKWGATNARSQEGTVIAQTVINRSILTQWLERLPGETKETVAILIDPADHQNVPRAYSLLKAIITVGADRAPDAPKLSPTDQSTHRAFALAGEMWDAFLQPFLSRTMSLSERLASFSEFAHLCFAFYRMHGSSFLSNQLYGDLQALDLDPECAFYLYQIGSDRLEEMFAEVRTESHDSNFDALQLSERLSTAADTLGIFDENPEWHQGHIRRSWFGKEADHVNPSYFTGDQTVKHVVHSTVWRSGLHAAMAVFAKHGVDFDFTDVLAQKGVDFVRPNGGGIYPGLSKDKDRSIITPPASTSIPSDAPAEPDSDGEDDEEDAMHDQEPEDLPRVSLEDLLPEPEDECINTTALSSTSVGPTALSASVERIQSNDWLNYDVGNGTTKQLHKASILSTLFNSDYRHLEVSRLLRVRCYTKDSGRKLNLNHQEFSGEHSFTVGDIAVALIRTGTCVAAAVVKVTVIEQEKRRLGQIDTEDLGSMDSKATITAQLLALRDTLVVVGDGSPTRKWLWTGEYGKFNSLKGPQSTVEDGTRKALTVKVPGQFLHPLDAEIESINHLPVADSDSLVARHMLNVWAVPHEDLVAVVSTLYESLDSATVLKLLPKHGKSTTFPYISSKGVESFILDTATQTLAEKSANAEKICCFQCHVSSSRKTLEPMSAGTYLKLSTASRSPTSMSGCTQRTHAGFVAAAGVLRIYPDFPLHARLQSAPQHARTLTRSVMGTPKIPPRKSPVVFWKYSMHAHIRQAHPRFWDDSMDSTTGLSAPLANNLAISREEMLALGVVIGSSTAPLASTLAPASRRGEKRVFSDVSNAVAGASTSTRRKT